MPIVPTSPCHERWSALTPNEAGRYCQRCDKSVVDLSSLTRREAEKKVQAAGGSLCGRMRVDPSGAPVFRRETERAAGLLGLAAASLLASCGSTTNDESLTSSSNPSVAASVEEPTAITTGGDHLLEGTTTGGPLTAMRPIADDRDVVEEAPTAEVASIAAVSLEEEGESVVPTDDQRVLTERKEEDRRPTARHTRRTRDTSTDSSTATDPAPATTRRRNNGGHATVTAPTTPPSTAINAPPPMYMGGISYVP